MDMENYRKQKLQAIVQNMKRLRKAKGWTQNDLAEECGFTVFSIRSIESHSRFPRPETLSAIAEAFGVKTEELMQDQSTQAEDIITKVFEKMKEHMKPQVVHVQMPQQVAPHLMKIMSLLQRLDARKDSVMISQLESMLEGWLLREEVPVKKKTASRR